MSTSLATPQANSAVDMPTVEWVHRTLRRDALRLEAILEGRVGRSKARQLARWYARYETFMTEHHRREDEQLFPALAGADPNSVDLIAAMADEHGQLEDAFARVGRALDALRRRRKPYDQRVALAAARAYRDVLERHLDHEEFEVYPRLSTVLAAEYEVREATVVTQIRRRDERYNRALVPAA